MRRIIFAIALSLVASSVGIAFAEDSPQTAPASAVNSAASFPFFLSMYGAFRNMMQKQDYSPKVQLHTVMQGGATEGAGAAAGLKGEITIIDGHLILTHGIPCQECGRAEEEHATLLVTAKVQDWDAPVQLPTDLAGEKLDAFIVERAKAAGLDVGKPFPVRLKGSLIGAHMHVIRNANPGFTGHGSATPMADQETIVAERIEGEVVGFYSPVALQAVFTHPAESFHYHWVDTARTRTAHLDVFGMVKGATLVLPKQ